MKTIDVNPEPEGWPPKNRGGGRKTAGKNIQISPLVAVAAMLLGLIVVGGIFLAVTGKLGVVYVSDKQVAVKVNYVSGERSVIGAPGYKIFLPFIQEIFPIDRSSQRFTMEGNRIVGVHHVPRLTVRARDGSNFWFETLEVQYKLIQSETAFLLDDSGTGDSYKGEWIKGFARSILRDEFGKYTAVEAADPTVYQAASRDGSERINELLRPHGIEVTKVITPKPKFDPEYERAIEERKEANQEVERLIAKEEQLRQERKQRLAAVQKEKEIEMQSLEGELVKELREAERDRIRIKFAADEYSIGRVAGGEAQKAEMIAQARGLTAKYTKEAEGLTKKAEALEERGEVVVREAIIEKLMNIRFTLIPYSRDPAPRRLEHSEGSQQARRIDADTAQGDF